MKQETWENLEAAFNSTDDSAIVQVNAVAVLLGSGDPRIPGVRSMCEPYFSLRKDSFDGPEIARFVGVNSLGAWLKMRFGLLGSHHTTADGMRYRAAIFFELPKGA